MLEIIYYVILIVFVAMAIWDLCHAIKAKKKIIDIIEDSYNLRYDDTDFLLYAYYEEFTIDNGIDNLINLRAILLKKLYELRISNKELFYYRKIFFDSFAFKRYMKDVENEINRRKEI